MMSAKGTTLQQVDVRIGTLRGHGSFAAVLSAGRSIQAGAMRCFVLRWQDGKPRITAGFAVSRNVRNAVARNRLRRLMREAYRLNRSLLLRGVKGPAVQSIQIVFIGLPSLSRGCHRMRYASIERDMIELLQKLADCVV